MGSDSSASIDSAKVTNTTAAERLLIYAAKAWGVETNLLAVRYIAEQFQKSDPVCVEARAAYDWMKNVCENPPKPTPQLIELMRGYSGHSGGHSIPAKPSEAGQVSEIADES